MTTQDKTFKKLKRIPLDEMLTLYNDLRMQYPPLVTLGNIVHEPSSLRPRDIIIYHARMKLLDENGWTFDEFVTEIERNAIIEEVRLFNESIDFPQQLIDRAKTLFPNIKFTPAVLEI